MNPQQHPLRDEELMAYVDGQLEDERTSQVAEHLKECAECSAAVDDATRVSQQMQTWRIDEPSPKLTENVLSELRSHPGVTPRRIRHRWNRAAWAYGLGGAAVAAVVVAMVVSPTSGRVDSFASLSVTEPSEVQLEKTVPGKQQSEDLRAEFALEQDANQFGGAAKTSPQSEAPSGPMVIRTAYLTMITKDFDGARARIESLARQYQGYLDHLSVRGEARSGRGLSATLRLPSNQIDAGLKDLRTIGIVREESQNSSDVTSQVVDLRARLNNSRNTEQRLIALLRERTGKLTDVVNVEREIARVREEIERMVAQEKDISNKVQFASIQIEVSEEYHAKLEQDAPSAATRLQNELIAGYHHATESALGVALFAFRYGPAIAMWLALLLPVVLLLRRLHRVKLG